MKKKRFFLSVLIVMLVVLLQTQPFLASGITDSIPLYVLGDTDNDGNVSIIDVSLIQRKCVDLAVSSYCPIAADADEDGEVTIVDATVVQRYLASYKVNEHVGKRFYDVEDIQKYTDDLVADLQVYLEEENSIISSNKFDKNASEASVVLNDKGEIVTVATYVSTGYIHCRKGQKIVVSRARGVSSNAFVRSIEYFDLHKNRLSWASSVSMSSVGFTTMHNAASRDDAIATNETDGSYYVKIYFPTANLDDYMVQILDTHANVTYALSEVTTYEPFRRVDGIVRNDDYWYGKKLAFDGDSIAQGYANGYRSYANYTAEAMGCDLSNTSIGGSTLAVKSTAPTDRSPLIDRLDQLDTTADALIINIGSNDWHYSWTPMGDMSSSDKYTFYGALKLLCADLLDRFSGKPVVLCTPIKRIQNNGLAYYEQNAYGKTMKDYCDAIKEVAEFYGVPVLDLYGECQINPLIESHKTAYFANADGVHPNAEGHTIIARRLRGYLSQLAAPVRE